MLPIQQHSVTSLVGRRIKIRHVKVTGDQDNSAITMKNFRRATIDAYGTRRRKWRIIFDRPMHGENSHFSRASVEASPATGHGSRSRSSALSESIFFGEAAITWINLNNVSLWEFEFVEDAAMYCYCRLSSESNWPYYNNTHMYICTHCGERYHAACLPPFKDGIVDSRPFPRTFVCTFCDAEGKTDKKGAACERLPAPEQLGTEGFGDVDIVSGRRRGLRKRRRVVPTGRKGGKMPKSFTCADCLSIESDRQRALKWTKHRKLPLPRRLVKRSSEEHVPLPLSTQSLFSWRQTSSFEWLYCVDRWIVDDHIGPSGAPAPFKAIAEDLPSSMSQGEPFALQPQGVCVDNDDTGGVFKTKTTMLRPEACSSSGEIDSAISRVFGRLLNEVTQCQITRCFDLDTLGIVNDSLPTVGTNDAGVSRGSMSPWLNGRTTHLLVQPALTRVATDHTLQISTATEHACSYSVDSADLGLGECVDTSLKGSAGNVAIGSKFRKRLRFDKSLIQGWGLFADEAIARDDFVIEYKGEICSESVMEARQKLYDEEGCDDYIFRIDKRWFCDATKKGSMARFINHSCNPNCYTKILRHNKLQKIAIYAKRDIEAGEELHYDYKFPYEENKIVCTCGSVNCRGYMN